MSNTVCNLHRPHATRTTVVRPRPRPASHSSSTTRHTLQLLLRAHQTRIASPTRVPSASAPGLSCRRARLASLADPHASPQDFAVLEQEYEKNPRPDRAARGAIASRVALNEKEVQVSFRRPAPAHPLAANPSSRLDNRLTRIAIDLVPEQTADDKAQGPHLAAKRDFRHHPLESPQPRLCLATTHPRDDYPGGSKQQPEQHGGQD